MFDGIKNLSLLVATGMAFVVTAGVLMMILFRDGNDSTRSLERYAERSVRPLSSWSILFNRFGLLFFLSTVAAVATYDLLPRFAPVLFKPLPTQTPSKR